MKITSEIIKGREIIITETEKHTMKVVSTKDEKYTISYQPGKNTFNIINNQNDKNVDVEINQKSIIDKRVFAFLNLLERSIYCPIPEIS